MTTITTTITTTTDDLRDAARRMAPLIGGHLVGRGSPRYTIPSPIQFVAAATADVVIRQRIHVT
jgi:hypothetical protein